ncbi:dipeptide ABC transporter ATP-binding protein [Microbacterium excoecariae]|uniref:dipeptide ABC transporter ATP-binding protein n=1 Tax=Microbacterium excoecariae TaxID=2715210 RepID=UPI00140CB9A5|nr:ABC transporter ATP-binding protein [Microbacterium excoecariae]NHI16103.1 ABC transporter ATP-binding protein [Microbacterium excoecariae]
MSAPVLAIEDLVLETDEATPRTLVSGVTLEVARGGTLGVVGESGSGKSLTMLSTLGLLPRGVRRAAGRILIDGEDVTRADARRMRALRGRTAAMVFQDPMSALDPLRSVGAQVVAAIRAHEPRASRAELRRRALDLLTSVGIRDAAERAATRPHQWSGGMRQRAMIAMAIAHDPLLIIADEPTTALDVTVQRQVMNLLDNVRERTGSALVLITHDLGLVSERARDLAVMRRGEIVEEGQTGAVLNAPAHEYTRALLAARPEAKPLRAARSFDHAREALAVDDVVVEYGARRRGTVRAVDGVSLRVRAGETVAVVGESGCGKSSLARAVLGIEAAASGAVRVGGDLMPAALAARTARQRERAQIVFQDPYSALNPRLTVTEIVAEPLRIRRADSRERVPSLLRDVGLDEATWARLPGELSGGQRQRVGIARALALRPELLILDEPVSALDVSIQAQVLDLLSDLQAEHGLGFLFISHDLGVVRSVADRVVVMRAGRVVEEGPTEEIFRAPHDPYTRDLLAAIPRINEPLNTTEEISS